MKNMKWMYAIVLILASSAVFAQTIGQTGIVAQVPFSFKAGARTMPAGECLVRADGTHLQINNVDAKASLMANAMKDESAKKSEHTELVFHRYGDAYFLSAIRLEGTREMYKLPVSGAEAELLAGSTPQETTLLASTK